MAQTARMNRVIGDVVIGEVRQVNQQTLRSGNDVVIMLPAVLLYRRRRYATRTLKGAATARQIGTVTYNRPTASTEWLFVMVLLSAVIHVMSTTTVYEVL